MAPSFLGLVETVVGAVVIGPHQMGNVPFRENGVQKLSLELVIESSYFREIFHRIKITIGLRFSARKKRAQRGQDFHFFRVCDRILPDSTAGSTFSVRCPPGLTGSRQAGGHAT
jgi:hypothetical protein